MNKHTITFAFLLLLCAFFVSPANAQLGNTIMIYSFGAPSGNCPNIFTLNTDETNSNLYFCPVPGSAWVKVNGSSSGGTVSSAALSLNSSSTCGAAAVTGSPVTTSGTLNINFTGVQNDIWTFNGSNCPQDSGTLLSSLAPLASPAFTGSPTVPTQTAGDASTLAASDAFVSNAISSAVGRSAIYAANYGAVGEGHFSQQCTITNSSNVITCTGTTFLADCQVGEGIFGTTLTPSGFTPSSVVALPETTVQSCDSNTQLHTVGNATSGCTGCTIVFYQYEDTAISNAVSAALTACATLILPGVNPEGDGPAVIAVKTGQFNSNPSGCVGSGGTRSGVGIVGQGPNSSYIAVTPDFNFTTCGTFCFGYSVISSNHIALYYSNFSISGFGNSSPSSGNAQLSTVAFGLAAVDNSFMHDVQLLFWGAGGATNADGIGIGLEISGGENFLYNVGEDGFGEVGRKYVAGTSNEGPVMDVLPVTCDNGLVDFDADAGANIPVYTTNGQYCMSQNGQYGGCVIGGSIWHSANDQMGFAGTTPAQMASGANGIGIGICHDNTGSIVGQAGTLSTANDGMYWKEGVSGNSMVLLDNTTSTFIMTNTVLEALSGSSTSSRLIYNGFHSASTVIDGGGNQLIPASNITTTGGTGIYFGSPSITGTVCATSSVVLTSGWGTGAAVSAATGDSHNCQFTITAAGTPASSPVLTFTAPVAFWGAPHCHISQIGGTFGVLSNPTPSVTQAAGPPTSTTDAETFTGTPVAAQTYTFLEQCN